jgi:hypothetical protein
MFPFPQEWARWSFAANRDGLCRVSLFGQPPQGGDAIFAIPLMMFAYNLQLATFVKISLRF